jgi:hypothetical protein
MLRIFLATLALAIATPAFAEEIAPITLSATEYQQIIAALMQKDPVIALLLQKEQAAQQAVKKPDHEPPAKPAN